MKILKKWWFWLIIIVAIAFLILGASESKKEEKINGSVISFVLQNSAFNDVSAQTDIKLRPRIPILRFPTKLTLKHHIRPAQH